jgi:hypothetical protein
MRTTSPSSKAARIAGVSAVTIARPAHAAWKTLFGTTLAAFSLPEKMPSTT